MTVQKNLVHESQWIILRRCFTLTFILIFSYIVICFGAMVAEGIGLMDEESSLFDLFMYITYSFVCFLFICMLIMATYAIRYIRYLWQEVGVWVAVYAAIVTLAMGTVTGYWWFYQREIKYRKHKFP